MAIHICRDFLTLPVQQHSCSMYIASCFAIGVLGYTQVGHTNFNVSGSLLVSSGISGSISSSSGITSVIIPSSSYTVSTSDVNRILALRSNSNPRHNSGLFRIESVNSGTNALNIAYRSTDPSIPETNSLNWTIFRSEQSMPGLTDASARLPNGSGGYQSTGASYNGPRIILQSPHSSSWQVRFCQESTTDISSFNVITSLATGFSGSSLGDFPTGSFDYSHPNVQHLHGPAWFNTSNSRYRGTVVGLNANNSNAVNNTQSRYYIWGDDDKGTIFVAIRNVANYNDFWFSFGLSEDDVPAPQLISQKLFSIGFIYTSVKSSLDIYLNSAPGANASSYSVTGFDGRIPASSVLSQFVYVGSVVNSPYAVSSATDNNIIQSTELHKLDIYNGITDSPYDYSDFSTYSCLQFNPRRIGSFPLARIGRTNFGNWSLSTDSNKSWMHLKFGVFLPWLGPSIL